MSGLLLAILRAASWSQQKPVQIPTFSQVSSPARVTQKAAGQAGAGRAVGGCPEPWPLGYKQWAQQYFRGMWCLPSLSSGDCCRIMSPTAFSDFFPILFQYFITAGFYRHSSFQKYWN